jgi:choline-sulfatase
MARIVYFDLDCLRPDHLGCYGYHRPTSPMIDIIAEQGIRFESYYCANSPCLPSRMALISGRFGIHNGVVTNTGVGSNFLIRETPYRGPEPENEPLPRRLMRYGYNTIAFSTFADRHSQPWFTSGWTEYHTPNLKAGNDSSEEVNAHVLPWLKHNARRENYLLYINYWDTHRFYTVDTSWADIFKSYPVQQSWPDEEAIRSHQDIPGLYTACGQPFPDGIGVSNTLLMPGSISSRENFELLLTGYDATIAHADHSISVVLGELDRQGVFDDAVIIISADHGEGFGEHGFYCGHRCANECTHRIPLIVRWPGVSVGDESTHALLYNVDLAPTLCDLLDIPIPSDWDGVSFKDVVQGRADGGRDYLVWDYAQSAVQRAVRTMDYLMIRTYDDYGYRFDPVELYEIGKDPYMTDNLCERRSDVVQRCDHYMAEWVQERLANPYAIADPLQRVLEERKASALERLKGE